MSFSRFNKVFCRLYRRLLYRIAGGLVLLLTTTGRKSGRAHTVGLQYELIDRRYWVGAALGVQADWFRNIAANPEVSIQVGKRKFDATAEIVNDSGRVADFLSYRLKKRPVMLRMILRRGGLKGKVTREKLLDYAARIRVVVFTPHQ